MYTLETCLELDNRFELDDEEIWARGTCFTYQGYHRDGNNCLSFQ